MNVPTFCGTEKPSSAILVPTKCARLSSLYPRHGHGVDVNRKTEVFLANDEVKIRLVLDRVKWITEPLKLTHKDDQRGES